MIMHAHTAALAAHAAAVVAPHAHGSVLVIAALAGAAGLTLWAFRYTRRLVCWLIAFAAGICAVGITVWSDALIALVTTPAGLIALIVIVFASGITFYLVAVHDAQGRKIRKAKRDRKQRDKKVKEARKRGDGYDDEDFAAELALAGASGKEIVVPRRSNTLNQRSHHHHLGSPAVAAIFGTSFSLAVLTFGLIASELWQSFTSLGSTVATQSDQVSTGKATAAALGHGSMSPLHVLLIAVAIAAAVLYAGHRVSRWIHGDKNKNNDGGSNGSGRGGRKKRRGGNRGGGGGGFGGGGQVQNGPTPQELGWH